MKKSALCFWLSLGLLGTALVSCSPNAPLVGSQTNWLQSCDTSASCGELECICGTCTATCKEESDCAKEGRGSCVLRDERGAIAACDGKISDQNMCLPRCENTDCQRGAHCVAGVCVPEAEPDARVSLSPDQTQQTLIGFGASFAYDENTISAHPRRDALLDALFVETGLSFIRLRNRFDGNEQAELSVTRDLIARAEARLGYKPTLLLTSGSPPAALKANGDRFCNSANPQCTLVRTPEGEFDYASFAEYWRSSLERYEEAGLHPDYVSIQNNPNYLPPDATGIEACRFLPTEGTLSVTPLDGEPVVAEFPGYAEALDAVRAAVAGLASYDFIAPDVTGIGGVAPFLDALDPSAFSGIATHFYGTDPASIDLAVLARLGEQARELDRPVFQTEMISEGLHTALLAHHALTSSHASVYLHHQFIAPASATPLHSLLSFSEDSFELLANYHALTHFSRWTQPGWVRVSGSSDTESLLASVWLSPSATALTLVLINTGGAGTHVELSLPEEHARLLEGAKVFRTSFDGVERSAVLGALSPSRVVHLPARAMVTVTSTPAP